MKSYILVGEQGVNTFKNEEWQIFEEFILDNFNADIISWDSKVDELSELLEMLRGWDDFIELTEEDLENIRINTKIVIP